MAIFSPDGNYILTLNYNATTTSGKFWSFNKETGNITLLQTLTTANATPQMAAFSHDGTYLVIGTSSNYGVNPNNIVIYKRNVNGLYDALPVIPAVAVVGNAIVQSLSFSQPTSDGIFLAILSYFPHLSQ